MNTPKSTDLFENQTPGYGMLKTLTLLTFIGCAFVYISLIIDVTTWGNYERQLAEAYKIEEQLSSNETASKLMSGSVEMIQKSHEHRYLLAATTLICTTLCLVGAMRMRKLRKSGYVLYILGELAPLAISGIFLGFSFFGGLVMAVSCVFALLFIILYTTQRKYLIYN